MRSAHCQTNNKNHVIFVVCDAVMDHKYKVLLDRVGARHIISEFTGKEQIEILRKLDITNFFILGKLESIKKVFGKYFFQN